MFQIVYPQVLISSLPLTITCMEYESNKLFVGTADGSILVWDIEDEPSFKIDLTSVAKQFGKKPIQQLVYLPVSRSLVVVKDDVVLCDTSLSAITHLEFKNHRLISRGRPSTVDTLFVSFKRKIVQYQVSSAQVSELRTFTLMGTPLTLHHLSNQLVFGSSKSVYSLDLITGSSKSLFTNNELGYLQFIQQSKYPHLTATLNDSTCLVSVGKELYKLDLVSFQSQKLFEWEEQPSCIYGQDYYCLGFTDSKIYIKSLKTGSLLQKLDFEKISFSVAQFCLIANDQSLWRLLPVDFDDQIDDLLLKNRFDDATQFIEELDFESEQDKQHNIIKVKGMYAQFLFKIERKFEKAIEILEDLNASPLDVLDLYPDLEEIQEREALYALSLYLARERTRLSKYRNKQTQRRVSISYADISDQPMLSDALYLSELVDTTLLRVYVQMQSPLLGSLLRVENYCHKETCEQELKKHSKIKELLDFYKTRGLHQQALEYLKLDTRQTIQYLVPFDIDSNLELVFEYSKKCFEETSEALDIFTENQIGQQSRVPIFEFLDQLKPDLAKQYLEYLVFELHDETLEINNVLLFRYLDAYKESSRAQDKLISFIHENTFYDHETALERLPKDDLLEERAYVLSLLNRHKEALEILVSLCAFAKAEHYCEQHHSLESAESKRVYDDLLSIYVAKDRDLEDNLHFMNKYGRFLDCIQSLNYLPQSVHLSQVKPFLIKSINNIGSQNKEQEILLNILRTLVLVSKGNLFVKQKTSVALDEDSMCAICLKRISSTIFTLLSDGKICHTYCIARKG
ncbi:hypothetical protein EDD86DRAFT_200415 [Gorgonomyces haynaldii]|nr:hypothetical protein EDD86DRAFT_200415 [Gorgonomyces haynaldii]